MAVGAAVILCDRRGMGPLVTPDNFDQLRPLNFGRRSLSRPLTYENVRAELRRYSPAAVAEVSRHVREVAPLTLAVDRLLDLYHAVIEEQASEPVDPAAELLAIASYFEAMRPRLERGSRTTVMEKSVSAIQAAASVPRGWFRRAA
jgi:hypothetical protein